MSGVSFMALLAKGRGVNVTDIGIANGASGATLAVTVPAGGVPAGSLIVICISEGANIAVGGSVADTAGNTYTAAVGVSNGATQAAGFGRIFYAYNVLGLSSGNSITYTRALSGSNTAISTFYATGVQTGSSPLDLAASATGNSTTPSVASGTPAVAGELFVGLLTENGVRTYTQDTGNGWASPPTSSAHSSGAVNGGNQINAGSAAKTFAPTLNSATEWAAMIATFKAA